jgi:hypothetical protein
MWANGGLVTHMNTLAVPLQPGHAQGPETKTSFVIMIEPLEDKKREGLLLKQTLSPFMPPSSSIPSQPQEMSLISPGHYSKGGIHLAQATTRCSVRRPTDRPR